MSKSKGIIAATVLTLLVTLQAYSQKIYSVDSKYRADVVVYVVDSQTKADLVVYKTKHRYVAKAEENEGIWYIAPSAYQADKKVYFTDRPSEADFKVYFTDSKYRAGWRDSSKKPLMY